MSLINSLFSMGFGINLDGLDRFLSPREHLDLDDLERFGDVWISVEGTLYTE
jgi:hypothetical protein